MLISSPEKLTALASLNPLRRKYGPLRPNGSLQYREELLNPGFLFLRQLSRPAEQAGVEFGCQQCILKALHHPIDDGNDEFNLQLVAQFAALQSKTNELDSSVGIDRKSTRLNS